MKQFIATWRRRRLHKAVESFVRGRGDKLRKVIRRADARALHALYPGLCVGREMIGFGDSPPSQLFDEAIEMFRAEFLRRGEEPPVDDEVAKKVRSSFQDLKSAFESTFPKDEAKV